MGGKPPKPTPPPAPIPPVTETNADVMQASQDARTQALRKKGLNSTLLAGETGGTLGQSPFASTGKTLLG